MFIELIQWNHVPFLGPTNTIISPNVYTLQQLRLYVTKKIRVVTFAPIRYLVDGVINKLVTGHSSAPTYCKIS